MSNINQIEFQVILASHSSGHELVSLFGLETAFWSLVCKINQVRTAISTRSNRLSYIQISEVSIAEFLTGDWLLLLGTYTLYNYTYISMYRYIFICISCFGDLSAPHSVTATQHFLSPQQYSEIDYPFLMFTAELRHNNG